MSHFRSIMFLLGSFTCLGLPNSIAHAQGTVTVTPTGNAYVDGVIDGTKWSTLSFTYSFPSDPTFYTGAFGMPYGAGENNNAFKPFTSIQQSAINIVLPMYSAIANTLYTQLTETATTHAIMRYAESNSPSTAWAYYPATSSSEAADAWFNNSGHFYDNPGRGNYGWTTFIHETGHAMGLKHPHDTAGAFGTMPLDHDALQYTIMSYRSFIGASITGGLSNATWGFPQTLMMYDMAALQYMYGANYSTNSTDTVYKWSPTTGEMFVNGVGQGAPGGNSIFMTVWDGGGHDTYDFSNYTTNLAIDLRPGNWSTVSQAQLAPLGGGNLPPGNIANALLTSNNTASLIEDAIGGSGDDVIIGNDGDNRITGGPGNDNIQGGLGTNTAVYSGNSTNYSIVQNPDLTWTIVDQRPSSPDGTDHLTDIQLLAFADKTVAIGAASNLTVTTPASDNVNVKKVELYVNGILKSTLTATPYTFQVTVSSLNSGVNTFQSKVYDLAGNMTASATANYTK